MARVDLPSTRPLLDKLGAKEGMRVAVLALDQPAFLRSLAARGVTVSARVSRTTPIVFLGVTSGAALRRLATIERTMPRDGAVWVVWPKGRRELREDDVRNAALATGLVDVKVVAFSDTLSALKLVIPRARR